MVRAATARRLAWRIGGVPCGSAWWVADCGLVDAHRSDKRAGSGGTERPHVLPRPRDDPRRRHSDANSPAARAQGVRDRCRAGRSLFRSALDAALPSTIIVGRFGVSLSIAQRQDDADVWIPVVAP